MKVRAISTAFFLLSATAFTVAQAPVKTPVSFEGKYSGCASLFVYRSSEDKRRVVIVEANKDALEINTPQTFDIGSNNNLKVFIDDYGEAHQAEYCTDEVVGTPPKPVRIPARSGKVTIYVSEASEPSRKYLYRVTVELKDVTFRANVDKFYYLDKAEMKDVLVGWVPG